MVEVESVPCITGRIIQTRFWEILGKWEPVIRHQRSFIAVCCLNDEIELIYGITFDIVADRECIDEQLISTVRKPLNLVVGRPFLSKLLV